MVAIAWPIVHYKMRREPSPNDPRGMGDAGSTNDPLQYVNATAVVRKIITPTRVRLLVLSYENFLVEADRFDPLLPKWGTFEPFGPTLLQETFSIGQLTVAAGAQAPLGTWTVPGAKPGDRVVVSYDQDLQGMQLTGYISVNNTAKTVLRNGTTGTVILQPGTLHLDVWRAP